MVIRTPIPRLRDLHGQFYRSEEYGNARNIGGTLAAATSTPILPGNRSRRRVTICNTGATRIDVTLGDTAVTARGFAVFPNGAMIIQSDPLGYIWVGPIALISTGTPTWSGAEET